MRAYASGLLWFLGVCGLAALAVVLIRRSWPPDRRADTHDVLSVVFSMTGTLYAVVAAFVFIDVWQIGNDARDATYREAQAVQSVAWAADAGPPEARARIQAVSRAYLREIIDRELPRLRDGKPVGDQGWTMLNELRTVSAQLPVSTDEGESAGAAVHAVMQAREDRLALADKRIGDVTWFALLFGALLAGMPILFFRFDHIGTQLAMTSAVAGMITLLLFTIHQIERPFTSTERVPATAYQNAADRLDVLSR
ncbi:hypothetical protein ACFQY4_42305 [Catellatospora bangladeshensis]|uniref:DUF4239 domain-containing protein n=1 Tax=Catellatospora bangladeshensis TaxID=310355 RepID=A0A8J3JFY6_9ACTN|nr:hypothetical protein [Catellatospora bangladeshensis]GIF79958.1 hypothetical protein Cba03nite_13070 [Catellatospora bangladeshensis]